MLKGQTQEKTRTLLSPDKCAFGWLRVSHGWATSDLTM